MADDYEREERIALVADGCRVSQEQAELMVKQMEVKNAARFELFADASSVDASKAP